MTAQAKIHKNFYTVTQRILDLIDKGILPWQQPWMDIKYQNLIGQKPYSGINPSICQLDCLLFGYTSPYFIGMAQCRERDWKIKKSSKSTWLRYGGTRKIVKEKEGREVETYVNTFKWLQVFNLDCIDDGQSETKIADCIPQVKDVTPSDREPQMQQLVENSNAAIVYGGNRAYYIPSLDEVHLPHRYQFSCSDRFWAVMFHELGHWTGAEVRLNCTLGTEKDSDEYCFEELVADLTSSFLGYEFDLEGTQLEHHASYLRHYWRLLKSDPKLFFKASFEAQKAATYLLEG